jgi:2-phosphosulfolactate phosphatase
MADRMRQSGEPVLLCGEIGGFRPEGFDLGNSPREFVPQRVEGARIILKTTNGTAAIAGARCAQLTVAAALANVSCVVRFLLQRLFSPSLDELVCLCAGREGRFSLEDFYAAGAILDGILRLSHIEVELSDTAIVAIDYFRSHRDDPLHVLTQSNHGRWLTEVGLGEDLPVCAAFDKYPVVPVREADDWLCLCHVQPSRQSEKAS